MQRRVSKALHGDACFRCAMEGGHGGLVVSKGPIAGNVSATGRHEALSSLIGVFNLGHVCVFSLLETTFFRFFSDFFRQVATLYMHCMMH